MNKYQVTILEPVGYYEVEADDRYAAELAALNQYQEEFGELPSAYETQVESFDGLEELNPVSDFQEIDGWEINEDGFYEDPKKDPWVILNDTEDF